MDAIVDRYFVLDGSNREKRLNVGSSPRNLPRHHRGDLLVTAKLATVKHAVGPLTEAVGRLFGGRVPPIAIGLGDYFRDVYDHLIRLNQAIESQREMVTTATSVNVSLITLQESEVTKRLAAYGALVAVPTMIGGVYGMNFQHMPELQWQYGYPIVLAVMSRSTRFCSGAFAAPDGVAVTAPRDDWSIA
jgi:magnesium transporter